MMAVGNQAQALARVAATFLDAATGGPHTLLHAVCALRGLLLSAAMADPAPTPSDVLLRLSASIASATPVIAESAASQIAVERTYLGMGAAAGFVSVLAQPAGEGAANVDIRLAHDRVDHVALLADELDALHRRQRIEARGDPLRRSVTIRRALAATYDGAPLH